MIGNNNKQNKKTRNIFSGLKNKYPYTTSSLNLPFNKLVLQSNKPQNENSKKSNYHSNNPKSNFF